MIDVQPISITTPHWSSITAFAKKYLTFSPVATLDAAGLSMKDVASYGSITSFDSSPLSILQNHSSPAHNHVSMGFIILAPREDINELRYLADGFHITKTSLTKESGHLAIIITGTVRQWHDLIVYQLGQKSDRPLGVCLILTQCLNIILQTTFIKIFQKYQRLKQTDGTILLERCINA